MSPEDPRHGTTAGHAAGCREACCREARNADERRRRKHSQVLGITRSTPALGTIRRIQALMAIGWTARDIAPRCGWGSAQAVTELLARTYVYTGTRNIIADVYDDLCMRPGPSAKNRRSAARKGWPPPLAWDDIDTDPQPVGWQYQPPSRFTRADTLAELDHLGHGITAACRRLQITRESLEKWCARHGMGEVYSRLVDREAMRYWSNGRAEGGAA